VLAGGGDVVGVVVGGAGACVTGVGGSVAGVDAWVGVVTPEPALELLEVPEFVDEPCVVDVTGCVVGAPGTVVAVVRAVALAGSPLRNTANHTLPTFCPCACPFFLSPSKV
jgi:hypothetical protein